MNVVRFPGIGINLNVSNIAFTIFGIEIYNYAICIVLGVIIALLLCKFSKENFEIKFEYILEICAFALIFGIIGARLYYIIFKFKYYFEDPIRILNLRDGGLAIYGGLILGAYIVIKKCKSLKIDVLDFFDYIVPFVAVAQSIGRWGNFFNIEAYGYETNNIFRMGIMTINGYLEVHPVFLYESILTFIIFIILRIMQKKRKFKGQILYLYLIMYSGIRMILENLRTDSLMLFNIRVSGLVSIIIFTYFLVKLIAKYNITLKTKKYN